jgi:hypothetical protein
MKSLHNPLVFVVTVLIGLLLSCKEEALHVETMKSDDKTARIASQPQEEAVFTEMEPYLDVLGKRMMWVVNNNAARSILYKEIEHKFDGDYNVLIETLINKYNLANLKVEENLLQTKFTTTVNLDFNNILKKFKDNEFKLKARGKELYPQIFIPFYDELKASGKIGVGDPILVIYPGNEHKERRVGYAINADHQIVKVSSEIDESYAKKHEVWVISLNERVFSTSDIKKAEDRKKDEDKKTGARAFYAGMGNAYADCQDLPYGESPIYGIGRGVYLKIPSLSIKTHKESWIAGASEVHSIATTAWGNGHTQYPPFNSITNTSPIDRSFTIDGELYIYTSMDVKLAEVRRSDVGQYYQVGTQNPNFMTPANYPFPWGYTRTHPDGSTHPEPRRDCVYYTIYEYDSGYNRESGSITSTSWDASDPSTNTAYLNFSSADSEFFRGYIYQYMAPGQPGQPCLVSVVSPDISFVISAESYQQ